MVSAGKMLALVCLLAGVLPSSGYMTNYTCMTMDQLIASQDLTRTGEPGKVEFMCKDFVNYPVVCDQDVDPQLGFNPSCNNTFAIQVLSNFRRALSVYNCKEYSRIWGCDNCTAAYHRWLCAATFRKCNLGPDNTTTTLPTCESNFTRTNSKALPDCVTRTCQDVCYDVVRKCPVHLEFRCPPVIDRREYVSSLDWTGPDSCNNLERAPCCSGASSIGASGAVLAISLLSSLLTSRSLY
mmetsp:Transcript_34642/g.87534  ORF Transcript_34642/g.87534 Transcript_34642/m.87534 type:complete len:239 (+) Transcript_34642:139-855(+)